MNEQQKIARQVIDYIESNLEGDLDLEKIAENAGYSRFHLNRIFTEETGCTIYKYLQTRRLTDAAKKLVETGTPIARIAGEAGYSSQQAFSLAFKQAFGCPPKVYRDRGIFVPRQNKLSMSAHGSAGRSGSSGFYALSAERMAA